MDLIIGAGISGLSYANFTTNDYQIIEKENEPGGFCRTIKRNNFVWDYSGHFFHFQNDDIKDFICKNIDANSLIKVKKKTQIYYNSNYIDFPFQKNIHQLKKEEFIDCLYDLYIANKQKNEYLSFKEMLYSKLGKSIAKKFLIPYNEKLYACDLNQLDVDAMGRFFPEASFDDILSNFKDSNNNSYNNFFTYPKGGAIEYIQSLIKNLNTNMISLNEELIEIDILNKLAKTNKRIIPYNRIISTIPLPHLISKCKFNVPKELTCNKVLVFNLGFDKNSNDQRNCWVYFPDRNLIFYRVGYYNNIIGGDKMSLYVELGFSVNEQLKDYNYYLNKVLQDLKNVNIVTNQNLVDYEMILMSPAYVHINRKGIQSVCHYKKIFAQHDIFSIGRYGSWTYCSIEDNIIEAKELAIQRNNG
jgi:protoporphyrinogen oxidase